jgi:ABC-2 type transport system ATP-binding protein
LHVNDLGADAIGDLAAAHGIALHELDEVASLEDAFIELTHDSVDFAAASALPTQATGSESRAERVSWPF